jgi:long-chain-fatty-acid--CoA ligase ACSBG
MLSHDNVTFQAQAIIKLIDGFADNTTPERVLSYLPLSHVAGLCMDIVMPVSVADLKVGTVELYFARPYDLKAGTLAGRLKFVKPTAFLGVPRVWEKIGDKVKAKGAATKGLKKKVATFAKKKGLEYEQNRQVGGSGIRPAKHKTAAKVLGAIKKALGLEECKLALTGAAPMPAEVQKYFGSLGISINDLYGMTECTGVTTGNNETTHMWGTVGQATPGVEVRILKVDDKDVNVTAEVPKAKNGFAPAESEQGEVCYRGRHIMLGYYANPALGQEHVDEINEKNAETIDTNGFLHSGDKGCCSAVNMFHITGRYKELIIGAGGENIAPVPVEDAVKNVATGISNFIMIGNQRKFNTALVTLKAVGSSGEQPGGDDLDPSVLHISPGVTKVSEAMKDEKWIAHIQDAITKINADPTVCISNVWKVGKFTILPRDMSVATDEFTPTLKTKRSYVDKKYVKVIDAMYSPDAKDAYVPCPPEEAAAFIKLVDEAAATPE